MCFSTSRAVQCSGLQLAASSASQCGQWHIREFVRAGGVVRRQCGGKGVSSGGGRVGRGCVGGGGVGEEAAAAV